MSMDDALRKRLVGAAVLVAVGVIFIPMILDGPPDLGTETAALEIPPRPNRPVHTRVLPVEPAAGTQLEQDPQAKPFEEQTQSTATSEPTVREQDESAEIAIAGDLTTWWVIQVGSFKEKDNAVAFRDRFRESGYGGAR